LVRSLQSAPGFSAEIRYLRKLTFSVHTSDAKSRIRRRNAVKVCCRPAFPAADGEAPAQIQTCVEHGLTLAAEVVT
jgi:hypothetical protein